MSLSHFLRQLQISFLAAEHNCLMYQESGNNLYKMSAAPRGSSETSLAANQVKFSFDTRHVHSFSMHFPNPNPLAKPHKAWGQKSAWIHVTTSWELSFMGILKDNETFCLWSFCVRIKSWPWSKGELIWWKVGGSPAWLWKGPSILSK